MKATKSWPVYTAHVGDEACGHGHETPAKAIHCADNLHSRYGGRKQVEVLRRRKNGDSQIMHTFPATT